MNFRTIALASIAGLGAVTALSAPALAQPYDSACVRANQNNQVAGTIVGAIGGALIGNAVAGHHDKGAGTAIGAIGGGLAGNAIAGANNRPCPEGYVRQERRDGPPPPPPGARRDFWYGAPMDLPARMDFMQDRINRAAGAGWISPSETRRANRELMRIRNEDRRLHYQDGPVLRPVDRDYLQGLLNNLSQRLHWAEHYG
ncbi:MAG TPA: glycine zipper 2TM domain-containing protein [Caulobacteraceae bacterium]|nr:glycine zipper 2TM domain-containing protein [Caulobacteraceae bacterium]